MFKVIKKDEWKSASWSGGVTNEIFIYPANANYSLRTFKARVSIANTDKPEKSKFTSLPGVDRCISKLEGTMFLEHEGHYDVNMENFQIDRFKGDWDTYSTGEFRDFNLMLNGIRGDLYFRELHYCCKLHLEHDSNISFLFLVEGSIIVNDTKLEKNDFFYTDSNIMIVSTENAKIFYGFIKEWDE